MWLESVAPPSRTSSEGGGGGVVRKHPLRLTFRVREGQPYLKKTLSEQIE